MECTGLEGLQEHLESRGHWYTMEHIQQLNHYDDLTIAFLQVLSKPYGRHIVRGGGVPTHRHQQLNECGTAVDLRSAFNYLKADVWLWQL